MTFRKLYTFSTGKPLEDSILLIIGNPLTMIDHRNRDLRIVIDNPQINGSIIIRILHGISDQIANALNQPVRVTSCLKKGR